MAFLKNRKISSRVFIIMVVFFSLGGIVPVFSQQILATYGIGGQFMDYERHIFGGGGFEPLAKGMTWNVNVLFIGKTGFTVSTEIDIVSDFQTAVLFDPVIGSGYVYYNKYFVGAIFNVMPKSVIYFDAPTSFDQWGTQERADFFMVPTLVGGYDFGNILISGQLSYMRGVISGVNGLKFSIGVGINAGNVFR
ncbi:hypothetical protein LQZ19_11610 [Treponema primitia]|uniref:hypothetical protein n=1 Tax=Treponema primitia TaxID=88058 RepID=UPI00397FCA1D